MNPRASRLLLFVLVFGLCVGLSAPLRAQVAGGTLSGTVTDPQGSAVVGAKVNAKNGATGITTDTTSNSSGSYSLVNILPANYDVSVTAPGFRTTLTKVTITVGSQQTLNFPLVVGEVAQTVEVTGAAPVIELANATISGNVESQQIVELPLNGRDWASLATLEPGVVQVRPHEQVDQPGGNLRGLGNQMTIDGNRPTQNVYRLNGIIVNDYSNAGPGNVLGASVGVDAIQEFSVLTANYSAEYGFTSGGVINAITKSGTNSFHGSAYEFIRNKAFDSNIPSYLWAPNSTPASNKPPFVRNQFGGSGGWKILKDKLFLFGDYEGLRQSKGIPVVSKVLSLGARKGDIYDSNGNPITPTQAEAPGLAYLTPTGGCLYPNSTNLDPGVAATCVDNFMTTFINALDPVPQQDCAANYCANRYGGVQGVSDNYFTLRADWKVSDKDTVDSSYYRDHSSWSKPNSFDNALSGYLLPNQAVSLEEAHIFSPSLVNSIRFGYAQSIVTNPGLSFSLAAENDKSFGILSTTNAPGEAGQGGGGAGVNGGLSSFGGFSPQGGFSDWVQNFQVFDDISKTIGTHTLKAGFEFIRNHTDLVNGNGNGSAGFGPLAYFLQNEPYTVREPTVPPFTAGNTKHYNRASVFGVYAQDDWKMKSNLTINVGLRYEMSTIPYEKNGKFILLPNLWSNPGTCSEDINGLPIKSTCSSLRNTVFNSNPTLKNFEPRVGFSWDPFKSGKTSVRGGFGLFDVLPLPFMFGLNALQASPAGAEVDLTNASGPGPCSGAGCLVPQGSFVKGLAAAAAGATLTSTGRWQYTDPNPKRNYVMQWNFNVQRQITPNTSVMVAYAGSRGLHNPFQTDTLNTCFPSKTSAGWLFPIPSIPNNGCNNTGPYTGPAPTGLVPNTLVNPYVPGLLLSAAMMSESWYKSLQINVTRKMSKNLQIEGSFTWQHSMDTSSGSFAGDNFSSVPTAATPWWDLNIVKGLSDFNVTRNLSINWLYKIPTPASWGAAGWVIRGWSAGGLMDISDGVPMWPLGGLASDPLGQNNSEPMDVLTLQPGCTPQNAVNKGSLQYLKSSCFGYPVAPNQAYWNANCDPNPVKLLGETIAAAGLNPLTCVNLMGSLARNAIIGPGLINFDMSFIKDNHIPKLGENFNVQFRADLFNIFNRMNLPLPDSGTNGLDTLEPLPPVSGDGFGLIDQQPQVPMREVQFSLKVVW